MTEPQQGATYDDLLAVARTAEELGFGAFIRSDHYLAMDTDGLPGPTDAWVTLAGLARDTSTIRLGTLMTCATFRLPGPLAIAVAQVDQMSGGRVDFGFGAGWFGAEHTAYGIPFPDTKERFDRYEEQLAILTGLWRTPEGERFSHDGQHYQLTDSPALPKPLQDGGPPVIIGGMGKRRTPELAAKYADEFNLPFVDEERGPHPVRPGPRGLRRRRPRPRRPDLVQRAHAVCRRRRGGARPPGRGDRRGRRRPPRERPRPAPLPRWSTSSAGTPPSAASARTSRCSTCPTSTTCDWWPRKWHHTYSLWE